MVEFGQTDGMGLHHQGDGPFCPVATRSNLLILSHHIDQVVIRALLAAGLSVRRRARNRHSAQRLILDRIGFRFSYALCRHLAEGER